MPATQESHNKDPRITEILDVLVKYAMGDFSSRIKTSDNNDEIDAIIVGLNTLAEETYSSRKLTQYYLNRIERVMEVLLKYTMLDFSDTLEISSENDEIDAIAIGLNTMAEELRVARETEAKQFRQLSDSRNQIEAILNNAPSAVIVFDKDRSTLRWNEKASEIFGYTVEEATGKPLHELVLPANDHPDNEAVTGFLKGNSEIPSAKQHEIIATRRDGSNFPAELIVSKVKTRQQELYITFINDISDRKAAEKNLIEANINLENSNKELEAFTYSVSHDLRAPLRAISGYSQLLIQRHPELLSTEANGFIQSISNNTRRMGQLIDDLLALSRYSRAELQRSSVDVSALTLQVIEDLGSASDISRFKFSVHPMPEASADANLLLQVMTNLLSNAIKYSSLKEQPEVEVGGLKNEGETVYYVKDNGSGFDMQFYNKLFGVFQRLHDSREYEGTGVGLAIVKRIITKHGGRIWAESVQGEGTTFYFTLK